MNATKKTPDMSVATTFPAPEKTVTVPCGMLNIDFRNGKWIQIDAGNLTPEVLAQAIMHGLKQKLVDAAAITRDPETGRSATIETKFDAVEAVAKRLQAGEWNKRREGAVTGGLLLRALVRMYAGRKTTDQIKSWLETKSDKEKAALRKTSDIAKHIEEIRAEDAAGNGDDLPDLLAELDGLGDDPMAANDSMPGADK